MNPEPSEFEPGSSTLSRRSLLLSGAGALGVILTGCSKGSGSDKVAPTPKSKRATAEEFALAQMFDTRVPVKTPLRLPLGLVDQQGAFIAQRDLPRTITARVGMKGGQADSAVELTRRDKGLERAYYPLFTTLSEPGAWVVEVTAGDQRLETTLTAMESADLPGKVVQPGERLPEIFTPTVRDSRGVNPICTATPQCPLHEVSLDAALNAGKPIVLLVSTPAFCQTAICGPVLDLLLKTRQEYSDVATMIHVEVYTDDSAKQTTDAVEALGLTYEPSLFLASPDGTLSERLDFIFDSSELAESLARLVP